MVIEWFLKDIGCQYRTFIVKEGDYIGFKISGSINLDNIISDLKKNISNDPTIFTSQNVGNKFKEKCTTCDKTSEFEILEGGKIKCLECGTEFKLDLNVK